MGDTGGGHDLGGGWPWTQDLEMLHIPPANNNWPFQVFAGTSQLAPAPAHCSTVPDLHGWGIPSEQGGKFSLLISCWNKASTVQKSQVNQLQGERLEGRAEMPGIVGGSQRRNVMSECLAKQQCEKPGVFWLVGICHMAARCLLTVTNIINKLVPPRDEKIKVHTLFDSTSKSETNLFNCFQTNS